MIDGIPNRPLYFYQKDIIGVHHNEWLVGGFETFGLFSIVYGIVLPIDFHTFQGG